MSLPEKLEVKDSLPNCLEFNGHIRVVCYREDGIGENDPELASVVHDRFNEWAEMRAALELAENEIDGGTKTQCFTTATKNRDAALKTIRGLLSRLTAREGETKP